jgi:hypothetical protein
MTYSPEKYLANKEKRARRGKCLKCGKRKPQRGLKYCLTCSQAAAARYQAKKQAPKTPIERTA